MLPASDEFDQSDAAMMTAIAFVTETLKYPFELLGRDMSADREWLVTQPGADQDLLQTGEVCYADMCSLVHCVVPSQQGRSSCRQAVVVDSQSLHVTRWFDPPWL